jgi:tetratricopeptide (TPR) repeat protein
LYKQTIKPPVYESRIRYWLQAASAIRERPIFGSGPGTFYLQSKRFQSAPLSYSWFAHSFVLEQFVEIGLVGVVLWGILFVIQGRLLIRSRNHAFLTGVILTFLYSLYEYNLNFIVIWLLFWSALGWLTGSAQFKKTSSPEPSFLVTGGIVLLFAFSLLSVGSTQATMGNNGDLASLFAPFVADIAKTSIENHTETVTPIQKKELSLLLFFHKKNPEILYAVAKYYAAMKQPNDAIWWYKAAISQDPKNFVYQQEYLQFVIENGFFSQAGPAIRQFSLHMLPARLHNEITSGSLTSSDLIAAWPSIGINELESNPPDLYFAKLYYLLGEQVLDKNILLTRQLWTLARDIYPDMGLLYHELASLEFYSFHDMNKAQKIIAECMRIPHATLHCKQISQNLENVPPPGYVTGDIVGYR